MAAKAGGAGRKRATGVKRSELLSVRLDDVTKAALEAAAERNQSTMSREASERLVRSLADTASLEEAFDGSENRGLAALIVQLSRGLKAMTNLSWREDPYVYREFVAGLAVLTQGLPRLLGLAGDHVVPELLKEIYPASAETTPEDIMVLPPPGELGRRLALGLLDMLPLHRGPAPEADQALRYSREYFQFPRIYRDLDLDRERDTMPGSR